MDPYALSAIAACALFFLCWLVSLPLRDASVVDAIWGAGFGVLAWVAWSQAPDADPARLVLPVASSLWGLRLSLYLTYRNWSEEEDPRYTEIRERNQPFWLKSLWIVFAGVPLLESRLRETRPAYADYVERTPAFFPGRPKAPS